jgi:pimeloyl-ACP methyl ester carboxylesterase
MRGRVTTKRYRYLLIVAVLAVLAAVPTLRASSVRGATGPHFYIVFLAGVCGYGQSDPDCKDPISAGVRARHTFAELKAGLRAAGIAYRPVYYSFDPLHPKIYTEAGTKQHITVSNQALQARLTTLSRKDPQATFDLVGYSAGGVIAAGWVATDGLGSSASLLPHIHSIVTLDSPVRGSSVLASIPFAADLLGGAVWKDMEPNSSVIRAIAQRPDSWWKQHGHLHTVANKADMLVPPRDALLGYKHQVDDSVCPPDILSIASCHGAVLQDAPLGTWIACHWITTGTQCAVTPTPTPSPTTTVVVSPTVTPTIAPPPPPPA